MTDKLMKCRFMSTKTEDELCDEVVTAMQWSSWSIVSRVQQGVGSFSPGAAQSKVQSFATVFSLCQDA